ncbi:MAG: amidohydrolase family protein [Planctomycetota bacterium]
MPSLLLAVLLLAPPSNAATEPVVGLKQADPAVHALTNATIHVRPGEVLEDATLIVRDGVIEAVGDVDVPDDAQVWDATGKTIYAGFIDAHMPTKTTLPKSTVGYWNDNIRPQVSVATSWSFNEKTAEQWRAQGIVLQIATPTDGLIHGTSAAVPTGGDDPLPLTGATALHAKLRPGGSWRDRTYPNSPMGAFALIRQAFYDAQWQERTNDAPRNDALAALIEHRELPVVVAAPNELHTYRGRALGEEFDLDVMLLGSGRSYLAAETLGETPVIVPLNFRKPPDVSSPALASLASLRELMLWDLAPENPARLAAADVPILFTAHGLDKPKMFLPAVRKAVSRGLSAEDALAALTTEPAERFGLDSHGTLEAGMAASFVVFNGDAFDNAKLTDTWVAGQRYAIVADKAFEPSGRWAFDIGGDALFVQIDEKMKGNAMVFGRRLIAFPLKNIAAESRNLRFTLPLADDSVATASVTVIGNDATGTALFPDGRTVAIRGNRLGDLEPSEADDAEDEPRMASYEPQYPLGAYGRDELPPQAGTHIIGATVWTMTDDDEPTTSVVKVRDGRIASLMTVEDYRDEVQFVPGIEEVEATSYHLTPGLIDAHSHIATDGGINESGQAITCEVRIADFLDPTDIAIYRQLAGGTTTANVLHGSANPIGGQNAVIKFRWGVTDPDDLLMTEAPQGVKFALGENVKQSNWGDDATTRYPQTRMGVVEIMEDALRRGAAYAEDDDPDKRIDLELEALAEVIAGDRLIHCHSYRQDEILALLRTLESMDIRIGTLQHILEGYKVAEEIAAHGAGASSFSDWWAFKFEVYDAIPYNAALMHRAGIVVSLNSDDSELGRRLNTEAAKAVKYGGVSEVEALKMVTINPAIQLGIDEHTGSIEVGKNADLVLWDGHPLDSRSRPIKVWVDGRLMWDRETDAAERERIAEMRATLIQKVLASGEQPADPGSEQPGETLYPDHDIFCHGDHGHEHGHGHSHGQGHDHGHEGHEH